MAGNARKHRRRSLAIAQAWRVDPVEARLTGEEPPLGPPRAVLRTTLMTAARCGRPFEDAWSLALPLALAHADDERARALAECFNEEQAEWRMEYRSQL
jgi:hypothetical protein